MSTVERWKFVANVFMSKCDGATRAERDLETAPNDVLFPRTGELKFLSGGSNLPNPSIVSVSAVLVTMMLR